MSELGTTTWRKRNYDRLQRLKEEAVRIGICNPSIIDVGPGGIVNFLSKYLPSGRNADWNDYQKIQRGLIQLAERILRKTNLFSLETSEPEEIARLFEDMCPACIHIIDTESRVIEAVQRMVERNELPCTFQYHQIDVSRDEIPYRAEIVVAYNIIQRTSDWKVSLGHIANSVKPGGLLSLRTGRQEKTQFLDENLHFFNKVNEGLYLRTSS